MDDFNCFHCDMLVHPIHCAIPLKLNDISANIKEYTELYSHEESYYANIDHLDGIMVRLSELNDEPIERTVDDYFKGVMAQMNANDSCCNIPIRLGIDVSKCIDLNADNESGPIPDSNSGPGSNSSSKAEVLDNNTTIY